MLKQKWYSTFRFSLKAIEFSLLGFLPLSVTVPPIGFSSHRRPQSWKNGLPLADCETMVVATNIRALYRIVFLFFFVVVFDIFSAHSSTTTPRVQQMSRYGEVTHVWNNVQCVGRFCNKIFCFRLHCCEMVRSTAAHVTEGGCNCAYEEWSSTVYELLVPQ